MSSALAFSKALGWVGVAIAVISLVVSIRQQQNLQEASTSYTYDESSLTTSVSNTVPVPIIYGTVKLGGNLIYSRLSDDKQTIYKLVAYADGPVAELYDLEFDDLPYNSSKYDSGWAKYYTGDGTQTIDSTVVLGGNEEERAKNVGGLKHLAYAAMHVKANENLTGSFNVTCMVKGSLVKVYKNATDLTDCETKYSDNPAWCVLDFMTRYNGCGMDIGDIDVQSFIDAAKYYDDNNYTLNLAIDEQRSRLEWINYMLNCCKGMLVYRAGKYSIFVEKKDEVVQAYTPNDIHDLSVWFSPLEEVPDIYRVTYVDPTNEWVKVQAEASLNPENYLRPQPYIETLELLGVTNFDQASRLAWFYFNQALTCQTYVEFKTDRRALNRTVGDIIEVTDYITEFQNKKFRVIKIEDDADGSIKLTCREYNDSIYNEQRGSASPVINVSTLDDPQAIPPVIQYLYDTQEYYIAKDKTTVSNISLLVDYKDFTYARGFHVWYRKVGAENWSYGGFYDTGTKVATLGNMEVGVTYEFRFQNTSRYGKVSEFTYSTSVTITGFNKDPDYPTNLRAEEVTGGFLVSWDEGEADVDYYEFYVGAVDEEHKEAIVYGNTYQYNCGVGQYVFYVIAVDTMGNRSTPAYIEVEIKCPDDVAGFDCIQNERNIEFHWNRVETAQYYILKEGTDWEYGNTLCTTAGQFFQYPYAEATSTQFWIKAYTDAGVCSVNPAFCTLEVASIPNRNMIYEYDSKKDLASETDSQGWHSGVKYNTHTNATGLQLDNEKTYGDYIYKIDLPIEYSARNWIEKTIIPADQQLELQWKDANFPWNSEQAKRRVWFPAGTDYSFDSWSEIAPKDDTSTQDLEESIPLNGTLNATNGATVSYVGTPSYAQCRFENGLKIDGNCSATWSNLSLTSTFSMSFTLSSPLDSRNDYDILTLKNDGGAFLKVHYRNEDDSFVVTLSTGEEFAVSDFSGRDDIMSFILSQDGSYFTFIMYSLNYDAYRICRERYTGTTVYNKLLLIQ